MKTGLSGKKFAESVQLTALVLQGFKFRYANQYLALEYRLGRDRSRMRWYVMRMLPLNGQLDKMFEDVLSARMVLTERASVFPAYHAILIQQDGERFFSSLEKGHPGEKISSDLLLEQIKKCGGLLIRPSENVLFAQAHRVRHDGGGYYLDEKQIEEEQLRNFLEQLPADTILLRDTAPAKDIVQRYECRYPVLHIRVIRQTDGKLNFPDLYMAEHEEQSTICLYSNRRAAKKVDMDDLRVRSAMEFTEHVWGKFREIEYINAAFVLTDHGFSVFQFDTGLDLCLEKDMPDALCTYIKERQTSPAGKPMPLWRILRRYTFALIARHKGFVNFMYRNWLRGLKEDNALRCTSSKEKRWAHKRGFYSYRIKQYGLTEENYRQFLSDYAYKRMRPLNNRYRKWFWDKLLTYYVLESFPGYMPVYYARSIKRNGEKNMVPFLSNEEDEKQFDVIDLLRREKRLAVKPAVGSHGKGFHKLEYDPEEKQFLMDGRVVDEAQIKKFTSTLEQGSIVSEYVEMHDDLKRIYDKVVCTIRIMSIQNHTGSPVKHAYLRIGTSSTGRTDNLASGGIVAPVDIQTGQLGKAEILIDHQFYPCPTHPDTGAEIQGRIPHWQAIRTAVEDLCRHLCVLEYLGFDIAVTQDGFKILEINTHQDLHKYPDYPQEVKDYLDRKRIQKIENQQTRISIHTMTSGE